MESHDGKRPIELVRSLFTALNSNFRGLSILGIGKTVLSHPQSYVKLLIQVGHEPLPSKKKKTFFGKEVMVLPGLVDYTRHIKKVDGWFGLYSGVGPKILHYMTSTVVTNSVDAHFLSENSEGSEKRKLDVKDFVIETCQLSVGKTAGVVASYPFHLISVRMMAQFVGRETCYSSMVRSVKEIYHEEGILGFFAGLVPHLLGDLLSFWLVRSLSYIFSYIIENYVINEQYVFTAKLKLVIPFASRSVSSMFTYPFQLVTSCMAVNNTHLAAGQPPLMPLYKSWTACWADLSKKGLIRRGENLMQRTVAFQTGTIN